jgi:hypothetical protein
MPPIVLLGPQRHEPTVPLVVRELGLEPPYAVITAGWQEREGETAELREDVGGAVVELWLYRRAHELFETDPGLRREHRRRQDVLRRLQEVYRLRLGHALEAARQLYGLTGEADVLEVERESAIEAVRALDRHHLDRVMDVRRTYDERLRLDEREDVAVHREQIVRAIDEAGAVLIAGGHVAMLLNRMRIFDLGPLLAKKPVVAWSAGAMAVAETVVLFHDTPPQGAGNAEVLDHGLGLARGILPLPHAARRLRLDDRARVSIFVRRFARLEPLALDDGSRVELTPRRRDLVRVLCADGGLRDASAARPSTPGLAP